MKKYKKTQHVSMQHLSIGIARYPTNVAIYMYTIFPQISTVFSKKVYMYKYMYPLGEKDQIT